MKHRAWMLPPLEGGGYVGCLNCNRSGRGHTLPMSALIAVGFGAAFVTCDGTLIYSERPNIKPKTLRTFENLARRRYSHDWRVVLDGPLHGETYQRQGLRHWVLVARNQGFRVICRVCGATCKCQKARGGICCGCHSHKVRRTMPAVDRLTEIRAREVYRDQLALPLYKEHAHAPQHP